MQTTTGETPERGRARIETHGAGVGPPTQEAVERRAREIAQIDGRPPEQVTADDRARASRELHNQTLSLSSDEARSNVVASGNPADMAVETGRRVESAKPRDEQRITEEEVKEGLREAEHERMLEAQRQAGGRQ
jgi:hypothetical protein